MLLVRVFRRYYLVAFCGFFFFKQKTAYEMRISDWSSDVCSSDLVDRGLMIAPVGVAPPGLAHADGRAEGIALGVAADEGLGKDDELRPCEIGRASCRERVCQYV